MSKAQYDIYIGKSLKLARSLVIKSELVAQSINQELALTGHSVDSANPASWKYYRHLAGRYHDTDARMRVKSFDNLQTIEFNIQNLQRHHATAREYRTQGQFYQDLKAQYPDQEMLIQGILNPIDVETAIEAADGTILYWDPELVEENETNLIPQLEAWAQKFLNRWVVRDYTLTDDLYLGTLLGVFYHNIFLQILGIRLANAHTRFAHSYLIREFLASHSRLDEYLDYLTKKQTLWLYRNIRFIERNLGKQETFEWLVENILTERGIPLAEWSMRHDHEDQAEEITPRVRFEQKSVNDVAVQGQVLTINVEQMLDKEVVAAKGNRREFERALKEVTEDTTNSLKDTLRTKVLESSVLDLTDSLPFTLADSLLNHWAYLTSIDRYTAVVLIDHPRTGNKISLTAKEAYVCFLYAYVGARGGLLEEIPTINAMNVRRLIPPTPEELWGIVESRLFTPAMMDALFRDLVPVGNYLSIEGFSDGISNIHENLLRHRFVYATREHMLTRVYAEQAAGRFYNNIRCRFFNNQSYTEWFAERSLDFGNLTPQELDVLSLQLLEETTGKSLRKVKSLKEIQAALLRLMAQLSSYSVQYIQDINTEPVRVLDWNAVRVGDHKGHGEGQHNIVLADVTVRDARGLQRSAVAVDISKIGAELKINASVEGSRYGDFNLSFKHNSAITVRQRYSLPPLSLHEVEFETVRLDDTPVRVTDEYQVIPYELTIPLDDAFLSLHSQHLDLLTSERLEIERRWRRWRAEDLKYDIVQTELDGLHYPENVLELYQEGLTYPDQEFEFYQDGLELPELSFEGYLEGLHYDLEPNDSYLNGLEYPTSSTVSYQDGLEYPTSSTVSYQDGLEYPSSNTANYQDGLEYPSEED